MVPLTISVIGLLLAGFYTFQGLGGPAQTIMAEARDMLMLFLSMEVVCLSSYVMAGYMRGSLRSTEASLKYVLFGAVSSAIPLLVSRCV